MHKLINNFYNVWSLSLTTDESLTSSPSSECDCTTPPPPPLPHCGNKQTKLLVLVSVRPLTPLMWLWLKRSSETGRGGGSHCHRNNSFCSQWRMRTQVLEVKALQTFGLLFCSSSCFIFCSGSLDMKELKCTRPSESCRASSRNKHLPSASQRIYYWLEYK